MQIKLNSRCKCKKIVLADFIRFYNGYAFASIDYDDNGKYNLLTITNVTGDRFIKSTFKNKIKDFPINAKKYILLNESDILISLTGNVGRVSLNKGCNNLLNQRVGLIIPNENINKIFLLYLLKSPKFTKEMERQATSIQKNISGDIIRNYETSIPDSLEEQKQIATFLSNIDSQIELLQVQLEHVELMKQYYMNKLFPKGGKDVPELRFKGFRGGWEVVAIGDMTKYIQPGKFYYQVSKFKDLVKLNDDELVPVYTAGKAFLIGYAKAKDSLSKFFNVPCILFDDFTTDVKIVSEPFYTSSSASKIIILSEKYKLFPIEILLNTIQNIKVAKLVHGRHWISAYMNEKILIPNSENEQKQIAIYINKINEIKNTLHTQLINSKQIKSYYLGGMFA